MSPRTRRCASGGSRKAFKRSSPVASDSKATATSVRRGTSSATTCTMRTEGGAGLKRSFLRRRVGNAYPRPRSQDERLPRSPSPVGRRSRKPLGYPSQVQILPWASCLKVKRLQGLLAFLRCRIDRPAQMLRELLARLPASVFRSADLLSASGQKSLVSDPGFGSLSEDQDVRELVLHSGQPFLVPHLIEHVEEDADERFEVLAVPDGLVGDRVELVVRCWAFDLDRDDAIHDDVRPGSSTLLFDRDRSTEPRLQEPGQLDLIREFISVVPCGPELFNGGSQSMEALGHSTRGGPLLHERPEFPDALSNHLATLEDVGGGIHAPAVVLLRGQSWS